MGKRFANVFFGYHCWIQYDDMCFDPVFTPMGEVHFEDMKCEKRELVRTFVDFYYEMPEVVILKDNNDHFAIFSIYRFKGDMSRNTYGAIYFSKEGFVFKSIKYLPSFHSKIDEKYFLTENIKGKWKILRYHYGDDKIGIEPAVIIEKYGPSYPDYCSNFNELKSFIKENNIADIDVYDKEKPDYEISDLTIPEEFDTDHSFGFTLQELKEERAKQRIANGPSIAPDNIQSLEPNEVFVFGSNLQGQHGGGAARLAYNKFGAVWGLGVGLAGQTYAIPTMHGDINAIKPYVDQFIETARIMRDKKFLVTKIGCGIAGFSESQIAPLFRDALELDNVALPREFIGIIKQTTKP